MTRVASTEKKKQALEHWLAGNTEGGVLRSSSVGGCTVLKGKV
jgi:hypothetical protein